MSYPRKLLIVGLSLMSLALQGQTVASKVGQMRIYRTQHLEIFFTGGFKEETPIVAQRAEAFLAKLEKDWSIQLPEKRIPITLGKAGTNKRIVNHFEQPEWLNSRYNPDRRHIEINILKKPETRLDLVSDALHHQIIHYLLNLYSEFKLPEIWEEGLARYFGRPGKSRDRFLAIWAFYRHKDLKVFLNEPNSFSKKETVLYSSAISRLFVSWAFETHPQARIPIIQAALQGSHFDEALTAMKLPVHSVLLQQFSEQVPPNFQFYKIAFTGDFWVILLGGLMLVWMTVRVTIAYRTCRMPHLELSEALAVRPVVAEHLFTGPALDFSRKEEEPAIQVPPRSLTNASISLPPIPSGLPQIVKMPVDTKPDLPVIPNLSLERPERNRIYEFDEDLDDLEDNLDDVFDAMTGGDEPLVEKKEAFLKGVDEDVDKAFGNWD